MKLYELRAESGLERCVRAAQKYRYLTALIPMLLVGLMLLSACELLEQRKPLVGGGPKLVTHGASSACPGRRCPRRAAAHTLIRRSSRRELICPIRECGITGGSFPAPHDEVPVVTTIPSPSLRSILTSVVLSDDEREYEWEYGLASMTCSSLQLASASTRYRCRQFQLRAVCCRGSARTFNPKVAGSNPARPHPSGSMCRSRSGGLVVLR
jgi:hypothetical protein